MSTDYERESILGMYIFETTQLLDQLEIILLESEKGRGYMQTAINDFTKFYSYFYNFIQYICQK